MVEVMTSKRQEKGKEHKTEFEIGEGWRPAGSLHKAATDHFIAQIKRTRAGRDYLAQSIDALPASDLTPGGRRVITFEQDIRNRLSIIFGMKDEVQPTTNPTAPDRLRLVSDTLSQYENGIKTIVDKLPGAQKLSAFIGNRQTTAEYNNWVKENEMGEYKEYTERHSEFIKDLLDKAARYGRNLWSYPYDFEMKHGPYDYPVSKHISLLSTRRVGFIPVGHKRNWYHPKRLFNLGGLANFVGYFPERSSDSDWRAVEMRARLWKVLTSEPGVPRLNLVNNFIDDYAGLVRDHRLQFRIKNGLRKHFSDYFETGIFSPLKSEDMEGAEESGKPIELTTDEPTQDESSDLMRSMIEDRMQEMIIGLNSKLDWLKQRRAEIRARQGDVSSIDAFIAEGEEMRLGYAKVSGLLSQLGGGEEETDEGSEAPKSRQAAAVREMAQNNIEKIVAKMYDGSGATEEYLRQRKGGWSKLLANLGTTASVAGEVAAVAGAGVGTFAAISHFVPALAPGVKFTGAVLASSTVAALLQIIRRKRKFEKRQSAVREMAYLYKKKEELQGRGLSDGEIDSYLRQAAERDTPRS